MDEKYESILCKCLAAIFLWFVISRVPADEGLYPVETRNGSGVGAQRNDVDLLWGQGLSGVNRLMDPIVSWSYPGNPQRPVSQDANVKSKSWPRLMTAVWSSGINSHVNRTRFDI